MVDEERDKRYARQIMGKTVVTKSGKRFGEVGNIMFETRTGELIQIVLRNPTSYAQGLDLERDKSGNLTIPYSAVMAIGDFVVVAEEDIV
jgi:sporulation protein YlmC with PRC-barrel domain